jgi:hypothetical protein
MTAADVEYVIIVVLTVIATAAAMYAWLCKQAVAAEKLRAQTELDSYKRVGTWYEHRVEELESETRQLAEQIVASGQVVRPAMPLPPEEFAYEYRTDPTGIVVERVDPREAL